MHLQKEIFEFDLILTDKTSPFFVSPDEFLDHMEEPLFKAFQGDVTPAIVAGIPVLCCSIEAEDESSARAVVMKTVEKLGYTGRIGVTNAGWRRD